MTNLEIHYRRNQYFPEFKKWCKENKIPLGVFHLWNREWLGFEAGMRMMQQLHADALTRQTLGVPILSASITDMMKAKNAT